MSIEKGMISHRQASFLIANGIMATIILFLPALMAKELGQDAWIAVFIATFAGFLYMALLVSLGMRFPKQNLVEYGIELLGPWLGKVLGFFMGLFFFYINGHIIRQFGELMVSAVMPETPLVVFCILLVSMAAYGVYLGLEVFARVVEIIFPLSLIVGLVIVGMAVPEMDFDQLTPVLTHSFSEFVKGLGEMWIFYGQGLLLTMLIPYIRHKGSVKRVVPEVTFYLNFAILLDIVGVLAIFGAEEASRLVFPTFELAKIVHLAGFVERIESLVVGVWVTTVGLKVMLFYYAGLLSFAHTFNLRDYRPLVLPGLFILIDLSILEFTDISQIRQLLAGPMVFFNNMVQLGIPLLLYLLALVKKKGVKGDTKNEEEV